MLPTNGCNNMLGLPGGVARNFNMWGGVGWGVSTLVFMCTHGTLLVCWCVHMVRGVGWGVSTLVFMCTHGTLLVCWCVHMVRCWCVDVYTWYAAGVFMCTHGALLVYWCVHMVRCWCVHVYTWYAAGVSCANVSRNRSVMFDCPSFPHLDWVQWYFFLPCVSFLSDSFCLLLVYVIYIYMYVYFMSVYICMQIVSNGNAVNYRWLLIFPPDLAKKTQVWTLSKHSMINCIWKHDMKSTCEQPHFIWKNTVKSSTSRLQDTIKRCLRIHWYTM